MAGTIQWTANRIRKEARRIHGAGFDFSLITQDTLKNYVKVRCLQHGEFQVKASYLLKGSTCPSCDPRCARKTPEHRQKIKESNRGKNVGCSPSNRMSLSALKKRIRQLSGNLYDLSLVKEDSGKYVTLICREHGLFDKRRADVISKKTGCPKCNGGSKLTPEHFFERAKNLQPKWFSFEKSKFVDLKTEVTFHCRYHGQVTSPPYCLINKQSKRLGCYHCNEERKLQEAIAEGRRLSPEDVKAFKGYRQEVRRLSNIAFRQNLSHLGKRSRDLHLDHHFSVLQGFLDGIDPVIVGHVTNLRLIPRQDNQSKGAQCTKSKAQLLRDYRRYENAKRS